MDGDDYQHTVVSAGDVNGDGFPDLLVTAPDTHGTAAAYLFLGGPNGPAPVPTTIAAPSSASGNGGFGLAVAALGDANHDGYADVAIGSPFELTETGVGAVYVYYGGTAGRGPTFS